MSLIEGTEDDAFDMHTLPRLATRGTTNGNDRGSVYTRRARRAWLMVAYASDVVGLVRCYRCGALLYNPDDDASNFALPLTIDRIIPGCQGGTYRRNNIRPACGTCNSSTGAKLARKS